MDGKDEIESLPNSVNAYKEQIKQHLGGTPPPGSTPYSAHSDDFRYDICASHENARTLMNDIGWAFQIYRSWGQKQPRLSNLRSDVKYFHARDITGPQNNRTGNWIPAGDKKSWYNSKFRDDHDDFYGSNFPNAVFDNRSVFGLPHNYGQGKEVGWDVWSDGWSDEDKEKARKNGDLKRRASPLLFHFHRLSGGTVVFVASVVAGHFLPGNARLRARGRLRESQKFDSMDWGLLKDFSKFVRCKIPAPTGGKGGGLEYTNYTRENESGR